MDTDTRMKWKTGIMLSAIIMAIVAAGQITIHDFIVKGTPTQSLFYMCGFILIFLIIQATEMKSYDLTHRIYVEIEHIKAYHIKESHWYDLPFSAIVGAAGYAVSDSAPFALIAFGVGSLLSYAILPEE